MEKKKEQDKVEEVEEGGVCGKTTEFGLAKLHSETPPNCFIHRTQSKTTKVGNRERESLANPIFEACNNSKRNNK